MWRTIFVLALSLPVAISAAEPVWRLTTILGSHDATFDLSADELEVRTRPGTDVADLPSVRGLAAARIAAGVIDGRAGRQDRTLHLPARLPPAALRALAGTVAGESGGEVLAVAYPSSRSGDANVRLVVTRQVTVAVAPGSDVAALARRVGAVVVAPLAPIPDVHLLAAIDRDLLAGIELSERLRRQPEVRWAESQFERRSRVRADPDDTLFATQWHLRNSGQFGSGAGNDINVAPVWASYRGAGMRIGIVDDGVQALHPDLAANYRSDLDIDLRANDNDASPGVDDWHGTCVAGCAAAVGDNATGVTGVAYEADLIGIRLIGGLTSSAQEALALAHLSDPADPAQRLHVSNNSWGDADDGRFLASLDATVSAAIATGVGSGRGGHGIVYAWAAGNGAWDNGDSGDVEHNLDNANYDRYLDRRVIPVGAIDPFGIRSWYSEPGANLHICAPGGSDDGGGHGIVTTDRTGSAGAAAGDYTGVADSLQGTSFASPIAAGAFALMLQARPTLTWRDVQHILALTAVANDPTNIDHPWQTNAAGYHFSNAYGFGRLDTQAAVSKALTWGNMPANATPLVATTATSFAVPDFGGGSATWSPVISAPAGFRAECVELTVNITHGWRGDLAFTVTSPAGTVAEVASRPYDDGDGLQFTFTLRPHWGELVNGTWTVEITDEEAGYAGTVQSLGLRIHGFIPPSTPGVSALDPTGFGTGTGDQVVTISGSGFAADSSGASLSIAYWGGTVLATTFVSSGQLTAVIPAALLAADGTGTITVQNPMVEIASGSLGGGTSSGIDADVLPGPSITAIADQAISQSTATGAIAFTIADADTATGALLVSASSANDGLVADAACVLSGTGADRTITVTPTAGTAGVALITVTVSDGNSSVSETFTVTVIAPAGSGGGGGDGGGGGACGAGAAGLGMLLLACTWLRPRRRRGS